MVAGAIQGPYFMTAYIAKTIAGAPIVLVAVDSARHDGSPVAVVKSELATLSSFVSSRGAARVGA